MATVYIQSESNDHLRLNNNTGSAIAQYEFAVIGNIACVADEAVANGSVGSFHAEDGLVLQIDATNDGVAGELAFGTVNQDVFWKPSTGEFSDTSTATYYKIGILKTVKDSNGIIEVVLNKQVFLVSTLSAVASNTADITEIKSLSGIPFFKAATLTAAAAATPVDIVSEAEVLAISATGVVVITSLLLKVNGATAWTDATATIVTVQDTAGTPVVGATYAKAQLTSQAILNVTDTGVTLDTPIDNGVGFTAGKGIQIAGDANFAAGSDIIVMVSGYII
jgi:hypothetical protein